MANLAYIQITRRCNERCRFCSNPPYNASLPFSEGKNIIDGYIAKQYDGVIISGGEPTLSEDLPVYLQYCLEKKFYAKMITNGQRLSSFKYLQTLKEAGLYNLAISLYSHDAEMMAFLTEKKDALENIVKALHNLQAVGDMIVDINIVINKYNADHLSKIVEFVITGFPFVRHFVFNNLDPYQNWASVHTDTIPKLNDFELELHKALRFLEHNGKTFRVERVPLCYMTDYAHFSTETRRIVKAEGKAVYFLDARALWIQGALPNESHGDLKPPYYGKAKTCEVCSVKDICAGLYEMDNYYSSEELYPLFVDKEAIVKRILS